MDTLRCPCGFATTAWASWIKSGGMVSPQGEQWATLPPMVATLRICLLANLSAALLRAGAEAATVSDSNNSVIVTAAPMHNLPSMTSIFFKSSNRLTSRRCRVLRVPDRRSTMISVPPARIFDSAPLAFKKSSASLRLSGLIYSTSNIRLCSRSDYKSSFGCFLAAFSMAAIILW